MTLSITGTGHHSFRLGALVYLVTVLPLIGIGQGRSYGQNVGNDVTKHVENLGNPFSTISASGFTALGRRLMRGKNRRAERIYARNIWDMHVYDGRLYLGAGNGSDSGPAPNAGPVPIICYNPVKEDFVKEGTVLDEQIDIYYTHRGRLYIPVLDALTMAYNAVQEGASGVDMGRNIFQSEAPEAMMQAIRKVVHEDMKPAEALELYETFKNQEREK
jgi:hypothetical protein